MNFWLSNGERPLGRGRGGVQHYKPSVVVGVDCEIKFGRGGWGSPKK